MYDINIYFEDLFRSGPITQMFLNNLDKTVFVSGRIDTDDIRKKNVRR